MTRFARAKGSKASNERREEDATPWHVMRQQLANQLSNDDLKCNNDLSQIVKNVTHNQLEQANEIWSNFDEIKTITKKKKKGNIIEDRGNKSKNYVELVESNSKTDQFSIKKYSSKNTPHEKKSGRSLKRNDEQDNYTQNTKKRVKLYKTETQEYKNTKISNKNTKKETVSNKSNVNHVVGNNLNHDESTNETAINNPNTKYSKKYVTGPNIAHRNNYNLPNSYTIIANGREIRIVRYDGFLVKKDDAEQLKTLRKKLRSQNIPTDKIKAIMKLERRKAEKALAREKNTVCFHCRKFGHNFADCPDIKESEMSNSGMCFKCGSTEHTHFQCKVSQSQNFRFAVCFVCKEQGHIARQCTLNPQGQYPKGGSCHLCGEVTHLRKDCPKAVEEKSSKTLSLNKLNGQLEDIDDVGLSTKCSDMKKKKLIKF